MARREIEDLECDQPFALAAARVIEVRAEELFEQSPGVLDLDRIERVHDMRVAVRRLQAAIEVFRECLPRKRRRAALKQLRALADALGERRDPDVSIEALEGLAAEIGRSEDRSIAALVERFQEEKEAANERLARVVSEVRLQRLRGDLGELAGAAREFGAGGRRHS